MPSTGDKARWRDEYSVRGVALIGLRKEPAAGDMGPLYLVWLSGLQV
jgi:hypothetical protein